MYVYYLINKMTNLNCNYRGMKKQMVLVEIMHSIAINFNSILQLALLRNELSICLINKSLSKSKDH